MYWRRLARSGMARNLLSQSRSTPSDSAENPRNAGESAGVASDVKSKTPSNAVSKRFIATHYTLCDPPAYFPRRDYLTHLPSTDNAKRTLPGIAAPGSP